MDEKNDDELIEQEEIEQMHEEMQEYQEASSQSPRTSYY